jgi:SAM-dependent methyltransferase
MWLGTIEHAPSLVSNEIQPCRHCGAGLTFEACDFGALPLPNRLLRTDADAQSEPRFPVRVMVCESCLLVQLDRTVDPEDLFGEYTYLSSVSSGWLDHAARFAAMATERFGLGAGSLVIEAGSNDGYLLRAFLAAGIPCLGIEPAANIAEAARRDGLPTMTAFFGTELAVGLARKADLLVANNVLAHAPELRDFVRGMAIALAPQGVISVEVPHVQAMLQGGQFDTVYHEHVFYFSALALERVITAAGLAIFDMEQLPTHGGSLRVYAQHAATGRRKRAAAVDRIMTLEQRDRLDQPCRYRTLNDGADRVIGGLRRFLHQARAEGKVVAGYGAAAKGAMLLNAAGITADQLVVVADASTLKQGHLMPGCHIPVVPPSHLRTLRPDYLLILPWNIAPEVMQATSFIADWGGRFVTPSPTLRVVPA